LSTRLGLLAAGAPAPAVSGRSAAPPTARLLQHRLVDSEGKAACDIHPLGRRTGAAWVWRTAGRWTLSSRCDGVGSALQPAASSTSEHSVKAVQEARSAQSAQRGGRLDPRSTRARPALDPRSTRARHSRADAPPRIHTCSASCRLPSLRDRPQAHHATRSCVGTQASPWLIASSKSRSAAGSTSSAAPAHTHTSSPSLHAHASPTPTSDGHDVAC
jgi:hypothetical protein